MTNHNKDQGMQASNKNQKLIKLIACGLVFSRLVGFSLQTQ